MHSGTPVTEPSGCSDPSRPNQVGLSLVEVIVALAIFSIFMLSTGATLMSGVAQRRHADDTYQALTVVRDFLSTVQEIANMPTDLTTNEGVGSLYGIYNGQTFTAPGLPAGSIAVTVHADETSVPTELGGPQDLNYDGDDDDNLDSVAAGPDLKVVPMTITVTYGIGNENTTFTFHRLVTNTVD